MLIVYRPNKLVGRDSGDLCFSVAHLRRVRVCFNVCIRESDLNYRAFYQLNQPNSPLLLCITVPPLLRHTQDEEVSREDVSFVKKLRFSLLVKSVTILLPVNSHLSLVVDVDAFSSSSFHH